MVSGFPHAGRISTTSCGVIVHRQAWIHRSGSRFGSAIAFALYWSRFFSAGSSQCSSSHRSYSSGGHAPASSGAHGHPIEIDEQQRPTHSCPSFHRAGRFGFDGVQPLTDGIKLIPMVGPCGPDGREFGPHGPLLRLPSTNRLFRRHRIRRSEHEERFADLFHIASGVPQRHEHGLRVG